MNKYLTWIGIIFFGLMFRPSYAATVEVPFYSENIKFDYEDLVLEDVKLRFEEVSFKRFYASMQAKPYQGLLNQFLLKKRDYNLNGYLYYELIHNTISLMLPHKSENYRTATIWFLLAESGYDVRLTHLNRRLYLYAYTTDNIYNVPLIEISNKEFVNISDLKNKHKSSNSDAFFLVEFAPEYNGQSLSFSLDDLPTLKSQLHTRKIKFTDDDTDYSLSIKVDKTIIELMKNYPLVDERFYLETPLSRGAYDSLIPQLRKILSNKSKVEGIKLLLSLTRSAFLYKTDTENFGRNKPMIPDEVIYYSYSDCEDRSALFYYLVKELLELPMIVVDYPDHLTIGVYLPVTIGKPLKYNGRRYTICDPTGPDNTNELGIYPKGYERKPYKIALAYK